jgi:hypothetical protein
MSFTQKLITLAVALANNAGTNQPNNFSEGRSTATIANLRTSVRVTCAGSVIEQKAQAKVWGLTPSLIYQLSTLGVAFNLVPKNTITITAGDAATGQATVFSGTIMNAYPDFDGMPDVPFTFDAVTGVAGSVIPAKPSSFTGSTDVATIMSGFAAQLGYKFENSGVNVQLPSPYFPGTIGDQVQAVAQHANISIALDTASNTLAIWPKGSVRNQTVTAPIIAPLPNGTSIGYPTITKQGVIVKTLFNPLIANGGTVQVLSSLLSGTLAAAAANSKTFKPPPVVNGNSVWGVYKVDHALDSLVRNGQWMSTVYCYNPAYGRPIPQQ